MQEDFVDIQVSPVLVNQTVSNEYTLYLDGEIRDLTKYIEHFSVFKNATPNDIVLLHINSMGGSVSIGQVYIKHMRECQCPIIGFIGVDCASQAAAIAMVCDDLVFDEMSTMLIHQFSYSEYSNANDVFRKAEFNKKLNERWVNTYFSEILSEDEYERVMSGQDVMLDSETLEERWMVIRENRRSEYADMLDVNIETEEQSPVSLH